ncbi:cell surface protein [Companilactobacillus sp. RD055328]|uniref:DUF916 and DUF3324 domain-containing protein n=1 Tax=Companilactobacillus sp. RD055328 TaxID=2916634 RepID=UPI001FC8C74A|nr:DUF916 and DUF3324 domain-containing protein [Companilactobacillus sp. RD055328]GKQ43205.1 cell surface protein [Companilactobacillus sp. RD055328]
MKLNKLKYFIPLAFLILLIPSNISHADNKNSGFSVTPIINDQQRDKNITTYFDLLLKPQEEASVTLAIHNKSSKEETFVVEANQSTSSNSGAIDYGQFKKTNKLDKTFESIVDNRTQEVKIPAESSKDVTVKVKMPEKEFEGILLGGLHVYVKDADKNIDESAQITNTFAYNIAVVLRNNENTPKSNFTLTDVKAKSNHHYPSFDYVLNNESNKIESGLDITAKIYKKSNNELFLSDSSKDLKMAPNSKMVYTTKSVEKYLKSGEYVLKLVVKNDDDTYKLSKNFTISDKQAEKINDESNISRFNFDWKYIALFIIIILLISVVAYLIVKLKRAKRG